MIRSSESGSRCASCLRNRATVALSCCKAAGCRSRCPEMPTTNGEILLLLFADKARTVRGVRRYCPARALCRLRGGPDNPARGGRAAACRAARNTALDCRADRSLRARNYNKEFRPRRSPPTRECALDSHKYVAFLSYSHRDAKWGSWLHKALESYRPPKQLVGTVTAH